MTIIMTVIVTAIISLSMIKNLSKGLSDYIVGRVKKENTTILKEAFGAAGNTDVEVDELIRVIKNSKEEITEVEFDMKKSSELLSEVIFYLNESLSEYNYLGYRIDVPVGMFFQNPLFVNLGPRIPIKVELQDVALGNVRTAVKSFGINSALIEVYLDISIRALVLYPFAVFDTEQDYSSLVASKIISGTVPSLFGGAINSKSDEINLPLN